MERSCGKLSHGYKHHQSAIVPCYRQGRRQKHGGKIPTLSKIKTEFQTQIANEDFLVVAKGMNKSVIGGGGFSFWSGGYTSGLWDLSFLTRDQTQAHSRESAES